MQGLSLIQATRLTRIIQELQDVREMPQQLEFMRRIRTVPADEGEIMGRFIGRAHIADLVADDQKAVSYQMGKLSMVTSTPPNLKVGSNLTQEQINRLRAVAASGNDKGGFFRNWQFGAMDWLLLGIRQRMEALAVAMAIDALNYKRFGIILENMSWGMPSDLKVTPSIPWTTAASATPVDDIKAMILLGRTRYGVEYDRVTMSTAAFRLMIATTEFQTKAKLNASVLLLTGSYDVFSKFNLNQQQTIASAVLGVQIVLYDGRYWSHGEDGSLVSAPFLPINKVVLDSTTNDNNATVMDFALSTPTEAILADMAPGLVGRFNADDAMGRPFAYATVSDPQLNPPGITQWAVARGFPRKFVRAATAVLTVGTFSDPIPVGEPF
jgi:hypothetical protein